MFECFVCGQHFDSSVFRSRIRRNLICNSNFKVKSLLLRKHIGRDKLKPFFDKFPHFPDDPLSRLPRQFISVSSCSLRLVLLISIFNFIICGVNTQRHKLDFCRIGCEVDADFSVLSRIGIHSLVEAFALSHCCWGNLMMSFK